MGQAINPGGERLEDRYYIQKVKLGQGTFGTVWRAVEKNSDQVRAVKEIRKGRRDFSRDRILKEASIMESCTHPNLLRLCASFEDSQSVYLVLEYCDGGDFGDKMKQRTAAGMKEHEVVDWMRQICLAIATLHGKDIVHRDIKPDNFMVSGTHPMMIKLTDFGLAEYMQAQLLTENCGTPAYMAPEQHRLGKGSPGYDFKVDVWAAGLILYQLMHRNQHPFVKDDRLDAAALISGEALGPGIQTLFNDALAPFVGQSFSEDAHLLCRKMMVCDPRERISIKQALQRPWLMQADVAEAGVAAGVVEAAIPGRAAAEYAAATPTPRGHPDAPDKSNELLRKNAELQRELQDHKAKLKDAEIRAFVLQEIVCQEPENACKTLMPQASQRGVLQAGLKCQYWSSSVQRWRAAVVQRFHESEGTYTLDVKDRANPDAIAPRADVSAKEAWPRSTPVTYKSRSGELLQAVVISFREAPPGELGTYDLDVRDCAACDRIRARCLRVGR